MNAGRTGACCEAVLLCESDSVRDDADAVEADASSRSCTASRKFDAIVGSPPANRMFMSRCGFTVRARSKICRTSSIESSWTYVRVVGVHEAGRAFQIAAVRQIDDQRDAASGPNRRRPVVVNVRVPGAREVVAEVQRFHPLEKRGIRREDVLERSVLGACLPHQDSAGLLEDVGVDHAWIASEVGDVREPVEHGADRFGVAAGTEDWVRRGTPNRGVDRVMTLGKWRRRPRGRRSCFVPEARETPLAKDAKRRSPLQRANQSRKRADA